MAEGSAGDERGWVSGASQPKGRTFKDLGVGAEFRYAGGQTLMRKVTDQRAVVVGDEQAQFYVDPEEKIEVE